MNTPSSLWRKLRQARYRHALVAENLRRSISAQIKAMRQKLQISQGELAERAMLTQGVVSRAENPEYGKLTFSTVLRIAAGLDVAFVGRFVPFSEFQKLFDSTSNAPIYVTRHDVPTFEEEDSQGMADAESRRAFTFTMSREGVHPGRSDSNETGTLSHLLTGDEKPADANVFIYGPSRRGEGVQPAVGGAVLEQLGITQPKELGSPLQAAQP